MTAKSKGRTASDTEISSVRRIFFYDDHRLVHRWLCVVMATVNLYIGAASTDLVAYKKVETSLQSSFSTLPSAALLKWAIIKATFATATIPNEIQATFLLLLLRVSRQSGSQLVSKLVSRSLGDSGGRIDVPPVCWGRLVALTTPDCDKKPIGTPRPFV